MPEPRPNQLLTALARARTTAGRPVQPIEVYDAHTGTTTPAEERGTAGALTARRLKTLARAGYVTISYNEAHPQSGLRYDLTPLGHATTRRPTPEPAGPGEPDTENTNTFTPAENGPTTAPALAEPIFDDEDPANI